MEEDCDYSELCKSCINDGEWPICIDSRVTLKVSYSEYEKINMYAIIECSNYEPLSYE